MAHPGRLNVSIQSRLMVMLLSVAVVSIGVISWISYSGGKAALTDAAFNQLTSLRASKKIQIEAFFKTIRYQVANFAVDRMMVGMAQELTAGFAQFRKAGIKPEWDRKLETFYRDGFLPELASGTGEMPRLEAFIPAAPAARYAQYLYIANNPWPAAERYKLEDAGDGSQFSRSHARYQAILTKLMLDFGYANLILVDYRTGDVVYTFSKSVLFATNLQDGVYSDTGIARLFRSIRNAGTQRRVQVADFAPAAYAAGKPVALMGAPVFNGADPVAVLFVQFPTDEINRVMTDNFGWAGDGLGKTGEVYLAGPDMLMRSRSRLLHEDPRLYFQVLEQAGYQADDIDRVRRAGTATLAQAVRTQAVKDALAGKTGTAIFPNYLQRATLSSFAPLSVPGLQWVIVADMETSEAFAPLITLSRLILISSLATVLGVTVVAALFGRGFVRPIFHLVDGVRRLKAGERNVSIEVGSRDEFRDLGTAFSRVTRRITTLGDSIDRMTRERDNLIDNMLPAPAAARMKQGQALQTDEYPEVSVLFASFLCRGQSSLSRSAASGGMEAPLGFLNDLTVAIDDAAERRGVDKLSSDSATYVASCGLSRQRLDHASRAIDFAQDVLRIVRRLHRDRHTDIQVRIGIDSGAVAGGVVGRSRFSYHLAGEPVTMAETLAAQAPPNSILVTRQVYASTESLYRFGPPVRITSPDGEAVAVWALDAGEPGSSSASTAASSSSAAPSSSSSTSAPQGAIHA